MYKPRHLESREEVVRLREREKRWRDRNQDKLITYRQRRREYHREWRINNSPLYKESAINIYSNGTQQCAWCSQSDIDVLCLDHIEDNGGQHRNPQGTRIGGIAFYNRLRKLGYPPGFQVLCANCNLKKEILKRRKYAERTGAKTVKSVMHKFKAGTLHSGSKHGHEVTSHAQAIAIAMAEAKGNYDPSGDPTMPDPYDHVT